MTPADYRMNLRGIWGDVLTDTVGIDQRNTAFVILQSTVALGSWVIQIACK